VSRRRRKTQGQRLAEALRTTGVSRRELAIALIGGEPSPSKIASKKTQILRWLKGDHGMSDDTARKVAAAFTSLGHPHTERAFFRDPAAARSWQEEIALMRKRQDEIRDEILEEIRKLREAAQ